MQGNYKITSENMISFLKEEGVRIGMPKHNVNILWLEKAIREEYPLINWVNINWEGTKLLIDLKENETADYEISKSNEAFDLKSRVNGIVTSVIVREGVPMVKAGDSVVEGQLLIGGRIPVYSDDMSVKEYMNVKADGDVWVRHKCLYKDSVNCIYRKRIYTGREKKHLYLCVAGRKFGAEYNDFIDFDTLYERKEYHPFGVSSGSVLLGKTVSREYQWTECLYSAKEATELLNLRFETFLGTLEQKGIQINKKNVKIEKTKDFYTLTGEITVDERAGEWFRTETVGDLMTDE